MALARYTPSGALDTTFGGDGKVVTDVTPDGLDHATGVVATPSGKLVVSGQAGLGAAPRYDADLLAIRYTATGRRDRTLKRSSCGTTPGKSPRPPKPTSSPRSMVAG